ncbi:MAG: 2-hydroxyacid dehydrogenase [Proteobacteria bacterium]|nr:2-hydroxyacid dehydrogenase [Pseudomonadota bacterium]
MKTVKIAFFDTKPYDRESFDVLNRRYEFDINYFDYHLLPDNVVLTQNADVVVVFVNDVVNAEMIKTMESYGVQLIALRCSGFNNIDIKAAKNKIPVVRVPAYSPNAIAEYCVALMLTLNRKIHRAYFRTRDANFALQGLMGFDMRGKTAGIIGTGKIGKALVPILKGFGMRVLASDPYPDTKFAKKNQFDYTNLETLFKTADIVSLNCPLTNETEYLINKDTIALMKQGVMLVNTGRGKLIRTTDLIQGLKSGKIGSAALDVYEEESSHFFEDQSNKILTDDILARLLTFHNVIITSHQGFFTREAMTNIAETTLENIRVFFAENKTVNEVIL